MDLEKILAITVSGVRPDEEAAVKALLSDCQLHTADLSSKKLRDFIVARKGDAVVGTIGLELFPPHALLRSLAVGQDHRGQGVGAQLIGSAERYARMMGVATLYLLTMTAADFFGRFEFRETRRDDAPTALQATEEFRSLCPDTAVCMRKQIA